LNAWTQLSACALWRPVCQLRAAHDEAGTQSDEELCAAEVLQERFGALAGIPGVMPAAVLQLLPAVLLFLYMYSRFSHEHSSLCALCR
jgi:hypothetical protein